VGPRLGGARRLRRNGVDQGGAFRDGCAHYGGLLLIFPGVVSDLIALTLLLLPGPKAIVESGSIREIGGSVIDGEYRRTR